MLQEELLPPKLFDIYGKLHQIFPEMIGRESHVLILTRIDDFSGPNVQIETLIKADDGYYINPMPKDPFNECSPEQLELLQELYAFAMQTYRSADPELSEVYIHNVDPEHMHIQLRYDVFNDDKAPTFMDEYYYWRYRISNEIQRYSKKSIAKAKKWYKRHEYTFKFPTD